jgi:hypothetical protein
VLDSDIEFAFQHWRSVMKQHKHLLVRLMPLLAAAVLIQPLVSAGHVSADAPDRAALTANAALGVAAENVAPSATATPAPKPLGGIQALPLTGGSIAAQLAVNPAAMPANTALLPGLAAAALTLPELTTTTVAIAPGGAVKVTGQNLGSSPGHLRLLFDQPSGSVDLQLAKWSDTDAGGMLPLDFAGYVDQKAHVKAITSTGAETNVLDIQFVATRQTKKLDLSRATISCNSSTQFDDCRSGENGLLFAVHISECCFNGVAGSDEYSMPALQNGWTFDHIDFANDQSEDDWYQAHCYTTDNPLVIPDAAGSASLLSRPQPGSASIDLKVAWKVNANCSPVDYKATVWVTGPAGVSEVWPVHPPSV